MSIDKSWMQISNRASRQYSQGVENFLNFAFAHTKPEDNKIQCPCVKCCNIGRITRQNVKTHLLMHGIVKTYTTWNCHGEQSTPSDYDLDCDHEVSQSDYGDDDVDMLDDMCQLVNDTHAHMADKIGNANSAMESDEQPNPQASKFFKLLSEAKEELYPNCTKFSRLSFIIKLLHLKSFNRWSNVSFTELLKILKEAFPFVNSLPGSYYECQTYIKSFGLHYQKIDACLHDCVLYWGEHSDADHCPTCKLSRWNSVEVDGVQKRIPHKVLRYFPVTERLKMLYQNADSAKEMRWHSDEIYDDDGVLRHPANTEAWKDFDRKHPEFAIEPRNVRLGLASDGFSPFGNMGNPYSTWPVVLTPYNLPPWLCMREPYFFLSLLIPGPKAPGNDIDVYLRPLIEELKQLWEVGDVTYDASKKDNFQMKAAVIWTINDLPAYGNLSGYMPKGKMGCPVCQVNTSSFRLKFGRKVVYMGHRRFLRKGHKWRTKRMVTPKRLSMEEVLAFLDQFDPITFGKLVKDHLPGYLEEHNWRKKSIFFELPYWKTLLLAHNLDVMHAEKGFFDNILGSIMGIPGKCKDSPEIRRDLEALNVRKDLWLKTDSRGKETMKPPEYLLSSASKKLLCDWIKGLRLPDNYSSNFSRCVKDRKISGLKSHDCHVLMEQLLPLVLHDLLPKEIADPLVNVCKFFRELCRKSLVIEELDKLEDKISETLSDMEKKFLPAFFDIMEHLAVHLAAEARIGGTVQYRWMYPIESYLGKLKSYVRNKARPEGSIAEGYIAEECLTFCSRYLDGVKTRFNVEERNFDGGTCEESEKIEIFQDVGRILGGVGERELSAAECEKAHLYVLQNCDEVIEYVKEHKGSLEKAGVVNVEETHNKEFSDWFYDKVTTLPNFPSTVIDHQILSLARGPKRQVRRFTGYFLKGYKFHTRSREMNLKTQNSGIVVKGDPDYGEMDYFGQLIEIIELFYIGGHRVILFKCDWFDTMSRNGVKINKQGFTMVQNKRRLQWDAPFVLAIQVEQVFYVSSIGEPEWSFVLRNKPRNFYDIPTLASITSSSLADAYQMDEGEVNAEVDNVEPVDEQHVEWIDDKMNTCNQNEDLESDEEEIEETTSVAESEEEQFDEDVDYADAHT